MNITDLIVEFIQQGNVVEIPGMGTLTSSNVSAYHDAATSTYYPARRTVALTSQQAGNKAIVRCIAERECVSTDTAEQIWVNFVSALDDKLQRNADGHDFPGMGTLRRDGGRVVFEALPDLDLDADKKHAQPLENVATYTPKDTNDPFAIFDRPAAGSPEPKEETPVEPAPVEPQPETPVAPQPETPAETTEPAAPVNAVDDKAAEKAAKEAEAARIAAAKEAERAAKEAERNLKAEAEKARREEEQRKKEEEKLEKARRKEAEREAREAIKKEVLQRRAEEKAAKKHKKRPRRRLPWYVILAIIILSLITVSGLGYFYYSTYYVPETTGADSTGRVKLPPYSFLSRNLDGIHYEDNMVRDNVAKVNTFMGDYIRQYLQARHYVNAYAVVMDRINEYADLRLHDLLSDDHYVVSRFMPYDDYYRDFCYRNLQEFGGYVARCRVQGELMDESRLDQFLDDLINELGLHPDGVTRPVAAAPKQDKAEKEYVEVVPPAPTFKASKQGFDIIAGFCTQKSKADKMANHLKDLGCDAYVINRSGLYYVSMGSASTRTGAEALYNHIKSWYQGDITIKNFNE